ncbi:hypothetical protein BELL_1599g00010 [Botrytis elliptica]|uniref:GH18 domain-containing protein n=1 Tax=Botrytis elliptica TaxID=278938 RepID=A0A4Z1I9G5_9HELO|nr:hypothetical protein BELL_1599g00010 [Botrytis elliptica]
MFANFSSKFGIWDRSRLVDGVRPWLYTTDLVCTNEGDTPYQNECDAVRRPSCSVDSKAAQGISIGYYESWSCNRPCDSLLPEQIQGSAWNHLNYAFALIDTTTFKILR